MNLFITSELPWAAGKWSCDQHIGKIQLECAQMLATCCHLHGIRIPDTESLSGKFKRPAYEKHQCTEWLAESPVHRGWAKRYVMAMHDEAIKRGYKSHISKQQVLDLLDVLGCSAGEPREFAVAVLPECREALGFNDKRAIPKVAVAVYRYYIRWHKPFATWRNSRPFWMEN